MPITTAYAIKLNFSQELKYNQTFESAPNVNASAGISKVVLLPGDNVIYNSALTAQIHPIVGLLFVPPTGNVVPIILKGDPADIGIRLHPTNPTLISVDPDVFVALYLNAASTVTGLILSRM